MSKKPPSSASSLCRRTEHMAQMSDFATGASVVPDTVLDCVVRLMGRHTILLHTYQA